MAKYTTPAKRIAKTAIASRARFCHRIGVRFPE